MIEANELVNILISQYLNILNNDDLNDVISLLINEYRVFHDIIVIIVYSLFSSEAKSVFQFFQGITSIKVRQPFIFFLTKTTMSPNVVHLFPSITNEYFDKRNVYAFNFPKKKEEIKIINNYFTKCMNYYYEIGQNDNKSQSNTFNILICGPAGVGKSCFINQFLNEKCAKEGEGLSVTYKITSYVHPNYPIKIIDVPGFESENSVKLVQKIIENFENDMGDTKNILNLILYFHQLNERNFYSFEIEFIKYLVKLNKKIMFVLNDFNNHKKEDIKRLTDLTRKMLSKILETIPQSQNNKIDEIIYNITIIKLKQNICENNYIEKEEEYDKEDNKEIPIIINQCYGMDMLFLKIYDMFRNHKIHFEEINTSKDIKELWMKVKNYELLRKIKEIQDCEVNIKIECSKLILSYSKKHFFDLFNDYGKNVIKLLEEIQKLNKRNKYSDFDAVYKTMKNYINTLKDKDKENTINNFFSLLKEDKENFVNKGFDLNADNYNKESILIGYIFLRIFNNGLGFYDEDSRTILNNYCIFLNNAIDGFLKLSHEWKETYEDLKNHKSKKEWINKFFILKLPKE